MASHGCHRPFQKQEGFLPALICRDVSGRFHWFLFSPLTRTRLDLFSVSGLSGLTGPVFLTSIFFLNQLEKLTFPLFLGREPAFVFFFFLPNFRFLGLFFAFKIRIFLREGLLARRLSPSLGGGRFISACKKPLILLSCSDVACFAPETTILGCSFSSS